MEARQKAMAWWNLLTMEEKMRFTRLAFTERQYTSLTGREIETVMNAVKRNTLRLEIINELNRYPNAPSYEMLLKVADALGIKT